MKKAIVVFLCIILSVFSGCAEKGSENQVKCVHMYETVTVDATCVKEGFDVHTCSLCGDIYKDNVKEPTKKHLGIGKCSTCGFSFFEDTVAYMVKNATYLSSSNSYVIVDDNVPPFSCLWAYDVEKNRLEISFTKKTTDTTTFFIVYYDNANGVYRWGMHFEIIYANQSFQMAGVYDAKTIFEDIDYISYTATSFPDYLLLDAQEMAAGYCYLNALFFQILLDETNSDITNWGYTNVPIIED